MASLISFRLLGAAGFKRRMSERSKRLKNTKKVNLAAIVAIDSWVQQNFKSEGDLAGGGSPWEPLSPQTLLRRRKEGKGAKILQDIGQLKSRWKHQASARDAKLQSGVDYGTYHDSDKPRKMKDGKPILPKRKILPTQEQAKPILKKIYEFFIRKSLK